MTTCYEHFLEVKDNSCVLSPTNTRQTILDFDNRCLYGLHYENNDLLPSSLNSSFIFLGNDCVRLTLANDKFIEQNRWL